VAVRQGDCPQKKAMLSASADQTALSFVDQDVCNDRPPRWLGVAASVSNLGRQLFKLLPACGIRHEGLQLLLTLLQRFRRWHDRSLQKWNWRRNETASVHERTAPLSVTSKGAG
jgi:hypothetical protein